MVGKFRRKKTMGAMSIPLLVLVTALGFLAGSAEAGAPEYLQLGAEPGMALEIEGVWDTDQRVFIADDIEVLPQDRLPKLRGEIQDIDAEDSVITIYGMEIEIYERTEFIENGAGSVNFSSLKIGMRVEVSCKFDDDGGWRARKIKTQDVKKSDKIKGTVTRVAIDGAAPDTLDISGILILLLDKTDIVDASGGLRPMEKELFPDIDLADMTYPSSGLPLGRQVLLGADYRQSVSSESQYDLTDVIDSDYGETEPAVRLELTAFLSERFQVFAQGRARKQYTITGDGPAHKFDAHFSQLYLLARNVGLRGLAIQVGRQDFDESREWLYDEYLDAARIYYYGTRPLVFETAFIHAVSPLKDKFETWTDFLLQTHIYPNADNRISSYFIMRSDSDARNREPKWYGIRYNGKIANIASPWMEFSYMGGRDKGRTLEASAFDLGVTAAPESWRFRPSATVGYAVGSGDKVEGDDLDNRFRQTGYEDNVDYLGGVTRIRYYGELIDPELSNIEILTAGMGIRPTRESSIDLVYHVYRQNHPNDELTGGDLIDPPARPNAISDDLGSEIDLIMGINRIWNHLSLSWIIGIFRPGEAFDPFLEKAVLNKLNLKIEI